MAIFCSQCGAQVPRPDVSRGPIVCARCATARSPGDDEDMPTVDHPPPARAMPNPRPAAGSPATPRKPAASATIPAPPPVAPARPSMIPRPSVGGPPGQRIKAGEARVTPSVTPRPATTPPPRGSFPPPPQSSTQAFTLTKQSVKPPAGKPTAPPPRGRPEIKGGDAKVAEDMDTSEFAPLETGDFEGAEGELHLATGDFESIPEKERPPQKPPRP